MLTAEKQTMELGTLEYGKVYTFDFMITNTSPKDMVVDKINVSCNSCTKAVFTRKVLGNQTTGMKVTFTPGSIGNQKKWIDIHYDNDQVYRVEFKGIVNG